MTCHCEIKTDGVGSVLVKSKFRWPVFFWSALQFRLRPTNFDDFHLNRTAVNNGLRFSRITAISRTEKNFGILFQIHCLWEENAPHGLNCNNTNLENSHRSRCHNSKHNFGITYMLGLHSGGTKGRQVLCLALPFARQNPPRARQSFIRIQIERFHFFK